MAIQRHNTELGLGFCRAAVPQLGRAQCGHLAANAAPAPGRSQWHWQTLPCSSVHPGCPLPPSKPRVV